MSYQSGSEGPNASGQDVQGPKPLPASAFQRANLPAVEIVVEGSYQFIINGQTSGSYFIATDVTGSLGSYCGPGDMTEIYNTVGAGVDASPITLPINACCWSGSGGPAAGDVTFVIRGGL